MKLQAARRERERIIAGQKSKNSGSERRSPHVMSRDFPTSLSRSMSVEWNQSSRERNGGSGCGLRSTAAAKGRGDLNITGLPEKVGEGEEGTKHLSGKGCIVPVHLICLSPLTSPHPPLTSPPHLPPLTSLILLLSPLQSPLPPSPPHSFPSLLTG